MRKYAKDPEQFKLPTMFCIKHFYFWQFIMMLQELACEGLC